MSGLRPAGSEDASSEISEVSLEAIYVPEGRATTEGDRLPPAGRHAWPPVPDYFGSAAERRAWEGTRVADTWDFLQEQLGARDAFSGLIDQPWLTASLTTREQAFR